MTDVTTPKRARGIGRLAGYESTEAQVQATIVQWLELKGYVFTVTDAERSWNRNGTVRRKRRIVRGWPDLTLVIEGRAVFVEVKSSKGRLSPEQIACHARLREAGALLILARSLDDVIAALPSQTEKGETQ